MTWNVLLQGGVLFKGNLRGQASKSYEKIARRMKVGAFLSSICVEQLLRRDHIISYLTLQLCTG